MSKELKTTTLDRHVVFGDLLAVLDLTPAEVADLLVLVNHRLEFNLTPETFHNLQTVHLKALKAQWACRSPLHFVAKAAQVMAYIPQREFEQCSLEAFARYVLQHGRVEYIPCSCCISDVSTDPVFWVGGSGINPLQIVHARPSCLKRFRPQPQRRILDKALALYNLSAKRNHRLQIKLPPPSPIKLSRDESDEDLAEFRIDHFIKGELTESGYNYDLTKSISELGV